MNKMTREEAINNLEDLYNEVYNEDSDGYIYAEAIDIAIEALHDVIKKPRTVRYKLRKPIEYVSIEFDEEETITHIEHYNEVVRCKDCCYCTEYYDRDGYPYWECAEWDGGTDADGFCHYGERKKK
jgi:hypothetical protein